jgi:hypothetical protein
MSVGSADLTHQQGAELVRFASKIFFNQLCILTAEDLMCVSARTSKSHHDDLNSAFSRCG